MKKLTQLLLAVASVCLASSALATPVYTYSTTGNPGVKSMGAGYYIWSDEARQNWSVRWTGKDASESRPTWFGHITLTHSLLGTTSLYAFESGQDNLSVYQNVSFLGGSDVLEWSALTNNTGGVDGFDFSLQHGIEHLSFQLGSSLYGDMYQYLAQEVDGAGIFIGENAETPEVLVRSYDYYRNGVQKTGIAQAFEVTVPEPASIALIGLGLIGLGAARRKINA